MRNILILNILLLSSCRYFQPKEKMSESIIARVGEKTLIESNLHGLIPANLSPSDSAVFVEKFVLDWVKKQLMISKVEEAVDFNEARIQNKVLDYQYALMVHEWEQKYIDANLNEEVSEIEIKEYYQQKAENFVLRQNLAKCIYFKVPAKAPNVWRLRRSLNNYPKDTIQIWEYANEHAVKAFVEDSVWLKFEEVLLETPLENVNDKSGFFKNK